MAKEIIIKKANDDVRVNPKYIVKGLGTGLVSTTLYKAGVSRAISRNGGFDPDKPLYMSEIGTPVLTDITIPSFEYTVDGVSYTVPEIKLVTVLTTVNLIKNIVKTPIQGLNGTIKEYISNGDNTVVITGKITGKNGVHPYQLVNDLKKLADAPVAFKVVSKFLQNLDIDTLVIEEADIPQEEGGYSYQKFTLNCVTDFPLELNIVSASNTSVGTLAMF